MFVNLVDVLGYINQTLEGLGVHIPLRLDVVALVADDAEVRTSPQIREWINQLRLCLFYTGAIDGKLLISTGRGQIFKDLFNAHLEVTFIVVAGRVVPQVKLLM